MEVDYWKGRYNRFASLNEQLRAREAKVILGVIGSTRSSVLRRWKALDGPLTDQTNEAKDNVKYLTTLEKFLDTLATGSPAQIAEVLPGFMSAVKMVRVSSTAAAAATAHTTTPPPHTLSPSLSPLPTHRCTQSPDSIILRSASPL